MGIVSLPPRIQRKSDKVDRGRRSPAHRAWIRGHCCSACGSDTAIECAHVRNGTDGGMSMKPSDAWCISLCKTCHTEQHQVGEPEFERRRNIHMKALACEFTRKSPHRGKLGL